MPTEPLPPNAPSVSPMSRSVSHQRIERIVAGVDPVRPRNRAGTRPNCMVATSGPGGLYPGQGTGGEVGLALSAVPIGLTDRNQVLTDAGRWRRLSSSTSRAEPPRLPVSLMVIPTTQVGHIKRNDFATPTFTPGTPMISFLSLRGNAGIINAFRSSAVSMFGADVLEKVSAPVPEASIVPPAVPTVNSRSVLTARADILQRRTLHDQDWSQHSTRCRCCSPDHHWPGSKPSTWYSAAASCQRAIRSPGWASTDPRCRLAMLRFIRCSRLSMTCVVPE